MEILLPKCDLGWCYFKGEGIEKNAVEAARWWRIAARQGHPDAQYLYGWCLDNGYGVAENKTEAAQWFQKSS